VKLSLFVRRFLIPAPLISIWYYLKFRCLISFRSEVDLSPTLIIGRNTVVGSYAKIRAVRGPLIIGKNVTIGHGCHIGPGEAGLTIGDDSLLGPHVTIIGVNYAYDRLDVPVRLQPGKSKGVVIGNDVWIGSGVCILDGAQIGNSAVVTPNSVVSSKVPDRAVVQGNPAKVIFTRR
jgi:acetyltransferase-like isoleucine patch superfamily enzyme